MAMQLAPGEKWRFEVDVRTLEHYRSLAGVTMVEMAQQAGIGFHTYASLRRGGICTFHTLARLATYYKVQPGELVIWYPVPEDTPGEWLFEHRGKPPRPKRVRRTKRQGKKWREPEIEKMIGMYHAGVRTRTLAGILGRTHGAVRDRLNELRKQGRLGEGKS